MKRLVFFILLTSFFSFGQTWQSVPGLPTNTNGTRFDDVFFINENLGWAVNGYFASAYKTTDGGLNWTLQVTQSDLGGSFYFRNIEFLDANIGFIGTINNSFFKTIDGGDNWARVDPITPYPAAICGINAVQGTSTVYACGAYFSPAYIIKSTDSGVTWSNTDMSTYANTLVELKFVDVNLGYAAGSSTTGANVLKTTDGGTTWSEIYNSNIAGEYIWKLQFVENNPNIIYGSLYATGSNPGKLIKSFDAGLTWTVLDAPETGVQAVGFISQTTGWMGGHNTGFFETTNGGTTWTNINTGGNLNRIVVLSTTKAYASGSTIYKFTTEALGTEDINDLRNELAIKLNSNPVENNLELSIDFRAADKMVIELYDINGKYLKLLSRDHINNSGLKTYNFNVDNLSSGSYILTFHSNTGRSSKKFIKS
jgi:photosystem II stability/assembly factor-like uncharacterized protein